MIRPVVLRAQRLETELVGSEGARRLETGWYELTWGHDQDRTCPAEQGRSGRSLLPVN